MLNPTTSLKILLLALGLITSAGCVRTVDPGGPLQMYMPAGWTLRFTDKHGESAYSLVPSNQVGKLTFAKWQPRGRPEAIPSLVQRAGEAFVTQTARSDAVQLASDEVMVETLNGERFNGSYVRFELKNGPYEIVQTFFMVSDGGPIWNGQFAGTTNDWATAVGVLKSLKTRSRWPW